MRRQLIAAVAVAGLLLAACGDDDETTPVADEETDAAATTDETTDEATATPTTDATADEMTDEMTGDATGETTHDMTDGDHSTSAAECAAGNTIEDGVLTLATGEPAFPPYVIDDAPESGEGFEAAVAMAVARELGFEGDAVRWIRTSFDGAIAPGPKDFDFNIQQYTITPERAEVVDFSLPYYTASQAIFGLADSPAAGATTLDELKSLKIGVAAGTTSVDYVENAIAPDEPPFVFNDNAAAKAALDANQIDAIVSDLPTALYITAVEIEGTTVFGQIEGSGTDQFGLLLAKDSPLTPCVDHALTALIDSGELADITQTWMADFTEAPVISAG